MINPWQISTGLLVICLVISVFFVVSKPTPTTAMVTGNAGNIISPQKAADEAVSRINSLLQGQGTAKLINVTEENDLYAMEINVNGQVYNSYVTKDGQLLFPSAIDLTEPVESPSTEVETEPEVPNVSKTDKPEAHVFVMSYCPYGLQFLKAYVPVIELLGGKANVEVNFVDYAMHGKKELDENTRMYCIQKEQKDKFAKYLRCFLASDDPEKCITEAGVDKTKLEACINTTDKEFNITELYNDQKTWSGGRFPQYPPEAELNSKYNVQGSPTFMLNGKVMSVTRSAEAIKQVICGAFNTPPEECKQTLGTNAEAPGIGAIGSGSASGSGSGGGCG